MDSGVGFRVAMVSPVAGSEDWTPQTARHHQGTWAFELRRARRAAPHQNKDVCEVGWCAIRMQILMTMRFDSRVDRRVATMTVFLTSCNNISVKLDKKRI